MDFRLVIDAGKVVDYLTKYVSKPEVDHSRSFKMMIREIMLAPLKDGNSVKFTLKKAMGKIMGQRSISKEEAAHLIFSIPMVSCSHNFLRVNLANNSRALVRADDDVQNENLENLDNNDQQKVKKLLTRPDSRPTCPRLADFF